MREKEDIKREREGEHERKGCREGESKIEREGQSERERGRESD